MVSQRKNKIFGIEPYSQETAKDFVLKEYRRVLQKGAYRALKRLLNTYDPGSLRPFYDCKNDKETILKTRSQAKNRAFTLASRIISRGISVFIKKPSISIEDREQLFRLLTQNLTPHSKLACDTELRIKFTNLLIEHFFMLRKANRSEKKMRFYLLTFSCDSWCSSELRPVFDLYRAKENVTALLHRYGDGNAIGMFEIQPLKNDPLSVDGSLTLMLHCHVLVWRTEWKAKDFKQFRKKVEKRLSNKRLKSPVHRKTMGSEKDDFLRAGSYLAKLPGYYKRWSSKTELVNGEKLLSRKRILRHLEILSYIPMKSLFFASGEEARSLKKSIWSELCDWNRERETCPEELSELQIKELWDQTWNAIDPKYSTPPSVRVHRHDR